MRKKIEIKSPYSGSPMEEITVDVTVTFRGESITAKSRQYLCPDTKHTFTTCETLEEFMDEVLRIWNVKRTASFRPHTEEAPNPKPSIH